MTHEIHPLRIYLLRQRRSMRQFAKDCGVHNNHLSLIVTGKRLCGADAAIRISDATDGELGVEELVRWGRDVAEPEEAA